MDFMSVHQMWMLKKTQLCWVESSRSETIFLQNSEDISNWILNPNFAIEKSKITLISYPLNVTCFSILFPTWVFIGSSLSQCSESSRWSSLGWVYFLPSCFQSFQSENSHPSAQRIFIELFHWWFPPFLFFYFLFLYYYYLDSRSPGLGL